MLCLFLEAACVGPFNSLASCC